MKKTLYIIIAALTSTLTFTSCTDWLDVSPKTDVPAEELFESENGFMSALAGIYISLTNEETYGKNLTFGLVEQLAQMYDKVPDGANDRTNVYLYTQATNYGYNTKSLLEATWLSQYNLIANANNLLNWLDKKGEQVLTEENTYNMIRGEALALRAYLHFDLLRGWGPINYSRNTAARKTKSIPYRTVADKSKQPCLAADAIVENIIDDLLQAKKLLSYEATLDLTQYENINRRCRMNYHAVNAMLARVYNYAGEYEEAKNCALEVIDGCGLELQNSNDNDPILSQEVLFGINMFELKDNLSEHFATGEKITTKNYLRTNTLETIYESYGSESDDMRAKGTAFARYDEWYAISLKYIDNDNEIIPLIRLPEMYYIACEASENDDEAATYINAVRNRRGISNTKNVTFDTHEQRIAALNKEYCKEFYGEGQYFWFLKTHGATGALIHCPEVSLTEENFIFPLPDNEVEFGWVENDNEEEGTGEETPAGNEGTITPRV